MVDLSIRNVEHFCLVRHLKLLHTKKSGNVCRGQSSIKRMWNRERQRGEKEEEEEEEDPLGGNVSMPAAKCSYNRQNKKKYKKRKTLSKTQEKTKLTHSTITCDLLRHEREKGRER